MNVGAIKQCIAELEAYLPRLFPDKLDDANEISPGSMYHRLLEPIARLTDWSKDMKKNREACLNQEESSADKARFEEAFSPERTGSISSP